MHRGDATHSPAGAMELFSSTGGGNMLQYAAERQQRWERR